MQRRCSEIRKKVQRELVESNRLLLERWNVFQYTKRHGRKKEKKKKRKEKKEAKDFVCTHTDMLFCYLIEVCSRITSGWKSLYMYSIYVQGLLRVMSFSVRSTIHICLPFQKSSFHFYVGSTSDEHSMSRRLFYYFLVS